MSGADVMTRGERDNLAKLIRRRAAVAKADAVQRSAELLADFERQLGAIFTPDDDGAMAALWQEAQAAIEAADAKLAVRAREMGIPDKFRPSIQARWYARGENGLRERRTELRKVAQTSIAALEKRAKAAIERNSVDVETRLIAGGLESAEAQTFLETMPTAEALMPALTLAGIRVASGELLSLTSSSSEVAS